MVWTFLGFPVPSQSAKPDLGRGQETKKKEGGSLGKYGLLK
jgi:hypothetical protein